MAGSSELVTVTCPDHHQTLTDGLWYFLQSNYGVDLTFKYAGREVGAHRLILDLFLSSDKLQDTVSGWQLTQKFGKSEMDCLLQFLYKGTFTVPKSQLGILLEFARQSEFRMLVEALESNPEVGEPEMNSEAGQPENNSEGLKRVLPNRKKSSPSPNFCKVPPKREARKRPIRPKSIFPKREKKKATAENTGYQCLVCSKVFSYRATLKRHTRIMHKMEALKQTVEDLKQKVEILKDKVPGRRRKRVRNRSKLAAGKKNLPASISLPVDVQHDEPKGDSDSQTTESQAPEQITFSPPINQKPTDQSVTSTEDNLKHQCPLCSKKFASVSRLRYHATVVHKTVVEIWTEKEEFQCDECQMVFGRKHHLANHKLMHANVRPFTCHLCEMAFFHSTHLKSHLVRHHGQLPYKCVVCNEAFETHRLLKDHMGSHQLSKPFKCSVCDLSFKSASGVGNHVTRSHINKAE